MEKSEIIEKLKSLVKLGSVSSVEKVYNFPKNNLGKVFSGKMELSEKWVKLFGEHFSRQDEDKKWRLELNKLGDYCKEKEISPQQMIDYYEMKGKPDYTNVISKIDPKAGDRVALNKILMEEPTKETKPPETPIFNNKAILAEIKKIEKETIPKERDTIFGRKVWALEQANRIKAWKLGLKS